jgi:nuclear pore complex protein Nup107
MALGSEDTLLGTSGRGGSMKDELEGIFDGLMKLDKGDLAASARNPFHLSQTYLIVGKIEQLFTTFVERLEQLAAETEEE